MSAWGTLLVVADDLGLAPEIDAGIVAAISAGSVAVADLLVNPPFQSDLRQVYAAGGRLGLHLNLSHGRPCSTPGATPSLVRTSGEFFASRDQVLAAATRDDAAREFAAQLAAFRSQTGTDPVHISVHKHLHAHRDDLFELAIDLAASCGALLRTLNEPMRRRCRAGGARTSDHFIGEVNPAPYWTVARLREQLAKVPAAELTELMCHPGYTAPPIEGLWYLAERETELQTLLGATGRRLLGRYERYV